VSTGTAGRSHGAPRWWKMRIGSPERRYEWPDPNSRELGPWLAAQEVSPVEVPQNGGARGLAVPQRPPRRIAVGHISQGRPKDPVQKHSASLRKWTKCSGSGERWMRSGGGCGYRAPRVELESPQAMWEEMGSPKWRIVIWWRHELVGGSWGGASGAMRKGGEIHVGVSHSFQSCLIRVLIIVAREKLIFPPKICDTCKKGNKVCSGIEGEGMRPVHPRPEGVLQCEQRE